MKTVQVYYLNDRKHPARVSITDFTNQPTTLSPAEGKLFEVRVADSATLFVKTWENGQVLLSYFDMAPTSEK